MKGIRKYSFIIIFLLIINSGYLASALEFNLKCPSDGVVPRIQSCLLMTVTNESIALTGQADNISIDIIDPDESHFIQNGHPYEYAPGIYYYNFTLTSIDSSGYYKAIATYTFNTLTFKDTGTFFVKWNEQNNFSRIIERIGNSIFLDEEEDQIVRTTVYHITQQDIKLDELQSTVEESTREDTLRDTALESLFQLAFSILLFIAVGIVGAILWSKRRTRRMITKF